MRASMTTAIFDRRIGPFDCETRVHRAEEIATTLDRRFAVDVRHAPTVRSRRVIF
jgi:hypothetical protein